MVLWKNEWFLTVLYICIAQTIRMYRFYVMIFRNKHKYNEWIVSSSLVSHNFVLLLCV